MDDSRNQASGLTRATDGREDHAAHGDVQRGRSRGDSAAAVTMVEGLRAFMTVTYVPLVGVAARLTTTTETWLLELNTGSSALDHCWAMIDVLRVVSTGARASESATTTLTVPRVRH